VGLVDVRLTIRPDETVRIHEGDVPQLAHQGLLIGEPVPVTGTEPAQGTAPVRAGGKRKTNRPGRTPAQPEGTQP
jgi:hypothetical protein